MQSKKAKPSRIVQTITTILAIVKRHSRIFGIVFLIALLWYFFALPDPLFKDPYCMILEDKHGELLGARIAADGQWRFPEGKELPEKYVTALLEFEDRRFYKHHGIDIRALGRAIKQNIAAGKIVSGGSTISMQIMRLSRKGKSRSVFQKLVEAILATRLEFRYSKEELLQLYAAHAPFGGNVVGLETASWRYFGKQPDLMSWSEAATLAVLPNSPALIHPGRNRSALIAKRNRLLRRLFQQGKIDQFTLELAMEETLPDAPLPLPQYAPHLLERAYIDQFKNKKGKRTRLRTTIDPALQERCNEIAKYQHELLAGNEIHNLAILVLDIQTGEVLAYVGNAPGTGKKHSEAVDIIQAKRSTGSIIKPFLFAKMLDDGYILGESLIPDVPTHINGYRPENYNRKYSGVVPAKRALSRSLNVPFVRMLQDYSVEKFHFGLQQIGFTTFTKPPQHYGLTLILGGAEVNLWEVTNAYACMARTLNHFSENNGLYHPEDFRKPVYFATKQPSKKKGPGVRNQSILSAAAIYKTFEAMQEVERPGTEGDWQQFQSSQKIAWKTGTSFGFRDAWAVGVNTKYAVGVWAGNADGEGRPGLVGVKAAAPILFDVFSLLPGGKWFEAPHDELVDIPVCTKSGYRALDLCESDTLAVPLSGLKTKACSYHQLIHLDATEQYQVNSSCVNSSEMIHQPWFVLPPLEAHYAMSRDPSYKVLPPFRTDCAASGGGSTAHQPLQLIYPKDIEQIFIPINLDGSPSATIFKATHRTSNAIIHWHMDDTYLGSTSDFHELALNPTVGKHLLVLVDGDGYRLEREFEVIGKE